MIKRLRKSELAVAIDSYYLYELKERFQLNSTTEVTRAAFTLLDWISQEINSGRVVISADSNGDNLHRLIVPELEKTSLYKRN